MIVLFVVLGLVPYAIGQWIDGDCLFCAELRMIDLSGKPNCRTCE